MSHRIYSYKRSVPINKPSFKKRKGAKPAGPVRHLYTSNNKADNVFFSSQEWKTVRYFTLKKLGRKCCVCFRTSIELHVDHIKPRSKFPELSLNPNNLQVLCADCNLGKSNLDDTDFRPGAE